MTAPVVCIDARKLDDFGIGTYLRGLIIGLLDLDDAPYALLVDARSNVPARIVRAVEEGRVTLTVVDAPGYSLREHFAIPRAIQRLRPGVYHSPHYVLPMRLPAPTVVTIHDIIHLLHPEGLPNRLAYVYAKFMIGRALVRSRRLITVSDSSREDILRRFGPRHTVEVIANGIDEQFLAAPNPAHDTQTLNELGLEAGYVLFVGNPKPHKNLPRLLAAWDQVRTDRELLLVGPTATELADARPNTPSSSSANRIRAIGRVGSEALPALYRGAIALAMPSLFEGFGLPVVEAMASGTPVLTSDRTSLKEIGEGAALLVDPYDSHAIARGLQRLIDDPLTRAHLKAAGHQRSKRFRWSQAAAATRSLYDSLLAETRAS